MRVFTTTPMFLLLALTMSSAQGQNAPAAATPAAVKPADAKTQRLRLLMPSPMQKNQPPAQRLPQQVLQMMQQQRKRPRQMDHPAWLRNLGLSALMNKTRPSAALAHSAGYSNVPSNARLNSY